MNCYSCVELYRYNTAGGTRTVSVREAEGPMFRKDTKSVPLPYRTRAVPSVPLSGLHPIGNMIPRGAFF